jgi:hypothetical protein
MCVSDACTLTAGEEGSGERVMRGHCTRMRHGTLTSFFSLSAVCILANVSYALLDCINDARW